VLGRETELRNLLLFSASPLRLPTGAHARLIAKEQVGKSVSGYQRHAPRAARCSSTWGDTNIWGSILDAKKLRYVTFQSEWGSGERVIECCPAQTMTP
jgi:hypothetical protein